VHAAASDACPLAVAAWQLAINCQALGAARAAAAGVSLHPVHLAQKYDAAASPLQVADFEECLLTVAAGWESPLAAWRDAVPMHLQITDWEDEDDVCDAFAVFATFKLEARTVMAAADRRHADARVSCL
jgi:hypothetical protein